MKIARLLAFVLVLVASAGAVGATCYVAQITTSGGSRRCTCAKMTYGSASCMVIGSDCILSADLCAGGKRSSKIRVDVALLSRVSVLLRGLELDT